MFSAPAFAIWLAGVALGLFCWPTLMTPPPDAPVLWELMFGTWALVLAVLFAMGRTSPRNDRGDPGR
jgi:hypothetical protein